MPIFQQRPVEVEAHYLTAEFMSQWVDGANIVPDARVRVFHRDDASYITLWERGIVVRGQVGQWLVKDANGYFVCSSETFEARYEPAGSTQDAKV
jgi:hypothetical protein